MEPNALYIVIILLLPNYSLSIYNPSQTKSAYTSPSGRSDVTSIPWQQQQQQQRQQEQVVMHHNYSKVSLQSNVTHAAAQVAPSTTTPVPPARKPRNYYHDAAPQRKRMVGKHGLYDSCPEGYTGAIPLSDTCQRFLNCYKGHGVAQPCAPGTLFNSITMECDHMHKVTCHMHKKRHSMSQDMRQLERPVQPGCPAGFAGIMPHYGDCGKYIQCANGAVFEMDCAPGTLFDVRSNMCHYPREAECFYGAVRVNRMDTGNGYDSSTKTQEHRPKLYPQLKPPYSANQDNYQTNHDRQQQHQGTYNYNQQQQNPNHNIPRQNQHSGVNYHQNVAHQNQQTIGNYPSQNQYATSNSQASSSGRQSNNNNNNNNNNPLECPPGNVGNLLPHPYRCDQYLHCDIGRTHVRPCGPGTAFNPALSVCDWPHNVNCSDTDTGRGGDAGAYHNQGTVDTTSTGGTYGSTDSRTNDGNYHNVGNEGQDTSSSGSYAGRDSRFHNGYVNQYNGNSGQYETRNRTTSQTVGYVNQYNGNSGQYETRNQTVGYVNENHGYRQYGTGDQRVNNPNNQNRTTEQEFDSEYHEHFGSSTGKPLYTQDDNDYYNGNTGYATTAVPLQHNVVNDLHPEEDGGYGYYQVRPSRKSQGGGGGKQWPPPFPAATNTDYDYVIDYEEMTTVKPVVREVECDDSAMFRCDVRQCVGNSRVCDMNQDCANGKDELNCAASISNFAQTKAAKLAIKEAVKYRNVSVTYCAKLCHETTDFVCKSFNYRSIDGTCFLIPTNVAETGLLIAMPTYEYYEHRSHQVDCTDMYVCRNKKCISRSRVCDGIDDCLDRADESACAAEVFGYRLSLERAQGGGENEGNLVVTAFGRRGYICDDMFTLTNAHVACKELGYTMGAAQVRPSSYYPPTATHTTSSGQNKSVLYVMDDVICEGSELELKDCYFTGWGVNDCADGEVVGVECKVDTTHKCLPNEWTCQSGTECLPLPYLCDGIYDCADSSDEWERLCKAPLQLRLSTASANTTTTATPSGGNGRVVEGRLEVMYHGTWGTVCDDGVKDREATVFCREVMKDRGADGVVRGRVIGKEKYGPGLGPIWLDQIACLGNETTITDCNHAGWNKHNCEHTEDVAIQCAIIPSTTNTNRKNTGVKTPSNTGFRSVDLSDQAPYKYPGKCGTRADDLLKSGAHFRVLNSPAAPPGTYPWQATISLRSHNISKPVHWCGAVIISPYYLVTAAHCLEGVRKTNIRIQVGDYDRDTDEGTEQTARVEDFLLHEEFRKGSRKNNDIAVVKLAEPGLKMTDDVKAICLPEEDVEYRGGTSCAVSGFGVTESSVKKASRQLRAGWIPIQPQAVCRMPHIYGPEVREGMFCAGNLEGGVDACDGDSGGPLACLHEGYYTLFGVTSWGHNCGDANKPGVYVKVAYYRRWIEGAIEQLAND